MKAHTQYLWFNTKQRQEIIDITDQVAKEVEVSKVVEGYGPRERHAHLGIRIRE